MAYKVIILYQLYMPSYFLGTFTEYPQVSMDGKNWGTPVQKGTFDNSSKEKQVEFAKPVQARYIRFTALSEQNGQDFASGAEITILAE